MRAAAAWRNAQKNCRPECTGPACNFSPLRLDDVYPLTKLSFDNLAADFAALVRVGVDIGVPQAFLKIVRLGIRQCRRALEWAREVLALFRDPNRGSGVLADLGGAVEMRGCSRAAKAREVALPSENLGGRVIGRRHRPLAGGLDRRDFARSIHIGFEFHRGGLAWLGRGQQYGAGGTSCRI